MTSLSSSSSTTTTTISATPLQTRQPPKHLPVLDEKGATFFPRGHDVSKSEHDYSDEDPLLRPLSGAKREHRLIYVEMGELGRQYFEEVIAFGPNTALKPTPYKEKKGISLSPIRFMETTPKPTYASLPTLYQESGEEDSVRLEFIMVTLRYAEALWIRIHDDCDLARTHATITHAQFTRHLGEFLGSDFFHSLELQYASTLRPDHLSRLFQICTRSIDECDDKTEMTRHVFFQCMSFILVPYVTSIDTSTVSYLADDVDRIYNLLRGNRCIYSLFHGALPRSAAVNRLAESRTTYLRAGHYFLRVGEAGPSRVWERRRIKRHSTSYIPDTIVMSGLALVASVICTDNIPYHEHVPGDLFRVSDTVSSSTPVSSCTTTPATTTTTTTATTVSSTPISLLNSWITTVIHSPSTSTTRYSRRSD